MEPNRRPRYPGGACDLISHRPVTQLGQWGTSSCARVRCLQRLVATGMLRSAAFVSMKRTAAVKCDAAEENQSREQSAASGPTRGFKDRSHHAPATPFYPETLCFEIYQILKCTGVYLQSTFCFDVYFYWSDQRKHLEKCLILLNWSIIEKVKHQQHFFVCTQNWRQFLN